MPRHFYTALVLETLAALHRCIAFGLLIHAQSRILQYREVTLLLCQVLTNLQFHYLSLSSLRLLYIKIKSDVEQEARVRRQCDLGRRRVRRSPLQAL